MLHSEKVQRRRLRSNLGSTDSSQRMDDLKHLAASECQRPGLLPACSGGHEHVVDAEKRKRSDVVHMAAAGFHDAVFPLHVFCGAEEASSE